MTNLTYFFTIYPHQLTNIDDIVAISDINVILN